MKIADYLKRYDRIFIDISVFKSSHAPDLITNLYSLNTPLKEEKPRIIILSSTLKGLEKRYSKRYKELLELSNLNILYHRDFPSNHYEIIFEKYTSKYTLLLITQDENSAKKVIDHNKYPEKSKHKDVVYLADNGELTAYQFDKVFDEDSIIDIKSRQQPFTDKYLIKPKQFSGIEKYDKRLNHSLPQVNDVLKSAKYGSITLIKELGSGGEGIVYEIDKPNLVCKIYRRDKLSRHKEEKINLLISNPLKDPLIAYPLDRVTFKNNQFVGYIMNKVTGKNISTFFFLKLSARDYESWNKADLVKLCLSVLSSIKSIHTHNLLLGDINGGSFLVKSPEEAYLVDVDSVQVEKYPCPVGRPEFTPPELLGNKTYREFFRTFQNEYYTVAILLFRIMMLGLLHTQVKKDTDDLKELKSTLMHSNINQGPFEFYLEEFKTKRTQADLHHALWSQLPGYIKSAFYNTFHTDGTYSKIGTRLSIDDWYQLFSAYESHLENGTLEKRALSALSLYPTEIIPYDLMNIPMMTKETFYISSTTMEDAVNMAFDKVNDEMFKHKFHKKVLQALKHKGRFQHRKISAEITQNIGVLKNIHFEVNR